ncbi:MAG: Hpt domain-containing protein [Cyanobacteria bacterium J06597_16]
MRRSQTSLQTDFDWQQLRQLAGEDAEFEAELLTMFLTDADSSLMQLEQAVANQDAGTVEEVAHSLRGASANVGAIALAKVASELENTARSGQLADSQRLLQQLQHHCENLKVALNSRA